MLIARAPVRISFAGGGTDLAAYYSRYGGIVVNAAVDKYFYVIANVAEGRDIQITSSDYRTFYRENGHQPTFWEGDLAYPRAILHEFDLKSGLSLFLASEVPPGTGLGSSSTVAVAIVKALATLREIPMSKQQVAEMACRIEIDKLGMPIGKQDQYASSFGGLNCFTFQKDGTVACEHLRIDPATIQALERRIMLFFTGSARNSSRILTEQRNSTERDDDVVVGSLHRMKEMAYEARDLLISGELDRLGQLLHRDWQEKKRLAQGVSNPDIDRWYEIAMTNGALGGKIAGAGGGGFSCFTALPSTKAPYPPPLSARGSGAWIFGSTTAGLEPSYTPVVECPSSRLTRKGQDQLPTVPGGLVLPPERCWNARLSCSKNRL